MGETYRVYDQEGVYFVTFTVHQWVYVFSRAAYVEILLANLLAIARQTRAYKFMLMW